VLGAWAAMVLVLGAGGGCREGARAAGPRSFAGGGATAKALPPVDGDTLRAFVTEADKPVLLSLWASWCGPCLAELPVLEGFAARHGERLGFAAINVEDRDVDGPAIDAALARARTSLPLAIAGAGAGALIDDLGARWNGVLPFHVLVDRHGAVLAAFSGAFIGADAEAEFAAKVLAKLPAGGASR
jgi:thiol-disulfide isomerase/thioredoxin